MTRLTLRCLRAMEEALHARLADEIDVEGLTKLDYENALDWVTAQIRFRTTPVKASKGARK